MKKTKIAVIGYGNIGKYVLDSIEHAPDMELIGLVRRDIANLLDELKKYKVVSDISKLTGVDVAILSVPSRMVEKYAKDCLAKGINTVDSFDIHTGIVGLRANLTKIAKEHNVASIIAAGWDPGTDSIVRSMFQFVAPRGISYTNFGPGMSMGHTVAAKAIDGVEDALSMTIPLGTGIHRRMVYVKIKTGYNFMKISEEIKADDYFSHDETHVIEVANVDELKDMGHGVNMQRKASSGSTANQLFEFNMKINNPALTAQVLVASARAVMLQSPGAYTMIEVPIIDFIDGDREALIAKLV